MCLSRLLVLVSTLPIGMAMGGPQGPEDQSVSSMNHFASNQHAHGNATLARKARQGNQGLLALSTLAAALVFTFLIYRCIVALAPRTKGVKNGVNSRRLSHNIGDACSYENLTEKTEKIEKQDLIEKKENDASRKWLRIGLIFGAATLITGLATMAVSIFQADHHHKAALAITDDHHHGLPVVLPHRPHIRPRPRPTRPTTTTRATTIEAAKSQLISFLPQNDIELDKKTTGYGTFPIANLNARLVNYLVLLKAEAQRLPDVLTDQDIRDGLAAVAKSYIKTFFEEMFNVADLNKAGTEIQDLARRVELEYRPTLDKLMFYANIRNQMDYENYKHAAASQMLMNHMPQFDEEGSGKDFKDFFTEVFPVEKMNLLLVNYFLALNQEPGLADKDIKKALAGATETLTNTVFENIFAVDVHKAGTQVQLLANQAKEEYLKSIRLMNLNMRVALQRRARAAAEAAKHVTPTVAKTVKEIEEGIFTLE